MDNFKSLIRTTPIILGIRILFISFLFSFIYFFLSIISDYFTSLNVKLFLNTVEFDTAIFFSLLVIQILLSFYLIINWYKKYYVIEGNSITYNFGLFFKKQNIYMLNEIKLVTFNQTFLGKLLAYGDIKIQYSDKKEIVTLLGIENPEQIIKIITVNAQHL